MIIPKFRIRGSWSTLAALGLVASTVIALDVGATAESDARAESGIIAAADRVAASRSAELAASQGGYDRQTVTTGSGGLTYVKYTRRYGTIPVLGGDMVVVVDSAANVRHTNIANEQPFTLRSIQPGWTAAKARTKIADTARADAPRPRLAVVSRGTARLVWESSVNGRSVMVDAFNGDAVSDGTARAADRIDLGVDKSVADELWRAADARRTTDDPMDARLTTLQAARDLHQGCAVFLRVRAAWDAEGVPVAAGEPSCVQDAPGGDFAVTTDAEFRVDAPEAAVAAGQSIRVPVTLTGSARSVPLAASGAPRGSTVTFDPPVASAGQRAVMTITTTPETTAGVYTVTIAGYGERTRTVAASFRVENDQAQRPTVKLENLKAHLAELGRIAEANGGNRMTAKAGHTKSLEYVEAKLKAAGYATQRVECKTCSLKPTWNLIADYPGGDEASTYMFGAHLDGVQAGPGINDNGSGSSGILEAALMVAQAKPEIKNHLRFAWWAGEEQGLLGSKDWVKQLPAAEKAKIKAYMNFDMIGSPNAAYFINNITTDLGKAFKGYFDEINVLTEENVEGKNRSDDASFTRAGIPASGSATGASYRMTAAQAQKWGGKANAAYDACYHQPCDVPTNFNATALDRMANSIVFAIWTLNVKR